MRALRERAPEVVLIVGGPEVSYEVEEQTICKLADYVITGWGEITLPRLLTQILHGPKPLMKVHGRASQTGRTDFAISPVQSITI